MKKIYLVGGAVRDTLMGKEPSDLDYVVVGSSPEEMIKEGFVQVGADFPVYLHPETKDEYALARTERKNGNGYNGFETFFDNTVTIEEDLLRRDITINAMAMDMETKEIIDPYNGSLDLKNKVIRAVSSSFRDDPLRVLRVARFLARFDGFTIEDETMLMMREMYDEGETKFLTKERIWKEFSRAIILPNGYKFFNAIQEVGLGKDIFPLLDGFMDDRNIPFTVPRIHASAFNDSLQNSDLKNRVARWSIPTYGKANLDVVDMWINLSAPKDVTDHVSNTLSLWNRILSDFKSIKEIFNADIKLFEIIKDHDGFRRTDRFLDAYSSVKDHFSMLSGKKTCLPEVNTISDWIIRATPSKVEISNSLLGIDKKDIKDAMDGLKIKKWNNLNNDNDRKTKFKI